VKQNRDIFSGTSGVIGCLYDDIYLLRFTIQYWITVSEKMFYLYTCSLDFDP
jgi:hypothetical protein